MQNSHIQTDLTQSTLICESCNPDDYIEEIPMKSSEHTETSEHTESKHLSNLQSQSLEKKLWDEKIKKEKIRVVVSQTGYTEEEALDKLTSLEWDCKKTIKCYLTGENNSTHNHQSLQADESSDNKELPTHSSENDLNRNTKNTKSINQQIYGEIRGLMDNASRNYYRKKERDAFMNEYLNRNVTKTSNED